ncbi:heme biosynthesis HemY N-terminal domain-containing protein [Alisedimentitalea sp. MJ-SS2]|uniref:heme biosynthesis protein HemY n=1 Tax=Aliisedimentitalea sp. MJ-SS2 TaxID=3049795 RepID=UPI002908863A|nr:heme biosynthesis HemY N-terminal domain-containing protein [Alisedimentitalea sp. MJ-SS2]MDU8927923.1 heme biosynthesis HemY N-terminal domain-containing protein [Alisedimentitalea sp. MJ-SS2]
MLWSLIKIVLFVVLVAAATLGAGYLLELDGGVRIAFAGQEFNLTPLMTVIAIVLLVLAVWIFLKLLSLSIATFRFLNGDETAISRYFDRNREKKGFQALSDGMVALASGEGRLAMAKAAKAEKFLQKPELTSLLTAQAAEMTGDKRRAEEVYRALLKHDTTRFIGVRGIMKQKLADGDTGTAMKLAKSAFALKPSHGETQDILLKLQAGNGDWKGARETLDAKLKHGTLPRDVHKRREAVLALSEAKDVVADDASVESREAAIEANRLSPDLIPAAVMAARGYIEEGKPRYATRVIKKAWDARPHPDLAAAFAAIVPDETPQARLKRFKPLVKLHPDHRETKLLLAELNIAAEDFPQARRELGDLAEVDPDTRSLTIMAAITRGEGASDAVVKGWLARALSAPRGPQWVCDNCHHIHAEWEPVCENCEALDTLSWTTPPQAEMSLSTGAEMLPLIVGAIEDNSDEDEVEEVAVEGEVIEAEEVSDTEVEEAKSA